MSTFTSTKLNSIFTNRVMIRVACAAMIFSAVIAFRAFWGVNIETPVRPAAVDSSSETAIVQLRDRIQRNPNDANAHAQLGLALLEQVRISGDLTLYHQAEDAFGEALQRDDAQIDALMGQGILTLARHDFEAALLWAEKARAVNPFRAQIIGIEVDAYVELGRYEEAVAAAQQMVDLRPDLQSYSRVSYVRELHGDMEGAITAMEAAADAGVPGTEGWLWAQVQLGNLYQNQGELARASTIYQTVLEVQPDYAPAIANWADATARQGNYQQAIELYEELIAQQPVSHYAVHLGEIYTASGEPDKAEEQYASAQAIQRWEAAAGMNVDGEIALFNVEHGDDPAVALAQARAAYESGPTIYAADTLASALYQNGELDEAWEYAQESLRLGTQDATLHFRAGLIAKEIDNIEMAEHHLRQALSINPTFEIADAQMAQEILDELKS